MGQYKEHFVINNRFLHLTQPSHELKCSSISFRTMNAPIFSHKLINDGPNPSWTVARNLARNWPETWTGGPKPRKMEYIVFLTK